MDKRRTLAVWRIKRVTCPSGGYATWWNLYIGRFWRWLLFQQPLEIWSIFLRCEILTTNERQASPLLRCRISKRRLHLRDWRLQLTRWRPQKRRTLWHRLPTLEYPLSDALRQTHACESSMLDQQMNWKKKQTSCILNKELNWSLNLYKFIQNYIILYFLYYFVKKIH